MQDSLIRGPLPDLAAGIWYLGCVMGALRWEGPKRPPFRALMEESSSEVLKDPSVSTLDHTIWGFPKIMGTFLGVPT